MIWGRLKILRRLPDWDGWIDRILDCVWKRLPLD